MQVDTVGEHRSMIRSFGQIYRMEGGRALYKGELRIMGSDDWTSQANAATFIAVISMTDLKRFLFARTRLVNNVVGIESTLDRYSGQVYIWLGLPPHLSLSLSSCIKYSCLCTAPSPASLLLLGLSMNYIKGPIAVSVSFAVNDTLKRQLRVEQPADIT